MRVREHVGEHEPWQEVIDLVEPEQNSGRCRGAEVGCRKRDVKLHAARDWRGANAATTRATTKRMPDVAVAADHAMPLSS